MIDTCCPISQRRRSDLVVRLVGSDGRYVVKDPATGQFFSLGEQESFLLLRLDGTQTSEGICQAFADRFGQPLDEEGLNEFLALAQAARLLEGSEGPSLAPPETRPTRRPVQLLAWRIKLCDPDRLFSWLAPRVAFLWTRSFVTISLAGIGLAMMIAWTSRQELVRTFPSYLHWQTVALTWLAVLVITACHECAHGLTCKHHGGEVHEVGVLMLLLMPCFYCNVSDAWLFPERSKRLWVTLAGSYCDLVLWALAMIVWRISAPATLVNHLAWVVLSVCAARVLLNINPLLKLDGYYLLSDLTGVANLRLRALGRLMGELRRWLWGAARPERGEHSRFLLGYGIATWLVSFLVLAVVLTSMVRLVEPGWRPLALVIVLPLCLMLFRELFQGFCGGEFSNMIKARGKRLVFWGMTLACLPAVLTLGKVEDQAKGPFQVRPSAQAELRAPVTGFLKAVYHEQGERVSPGTLVALLEVPDLTTRLAQKEAELHEAQAILKQRQVGARWEERAAQQERVERARAWRDLAQSQLERERRALREDLARLNAQVEQQRTELDHAAGVYVRSKALFDRRALSVEQLREAEKKWRVLWIAVSQGEAEKRKREAQGVQEAEAELSRRDQALAEARSALFLLEAGTRPEETEAAQARVARLEEEAAYLRRLQEKQRIVTPTAGLITTARLREKIGQFFREGELIAEVKNTGWLEAEITLSEQDAARVHPGQRVGLKPRALPFQTISGTVDRVAPAATPGENQLPSTVIVCCRFASPTTLLRPGMTGHARIVCGPRPVGEIALERFWGFVRTEFWW